MLPPSPHARVSHGHGLGSTIPLRGRSWKQFLDKSLGSLGEVEGQLSQTTMATSLWLRPFARIMLPVLSDFEWCLLAFSCFVELKMLQWMGAPVGTCVVSKPAGHMLFAGTASPR